MEFPWKKNKKLWAEVEFPSDAEGLEISIDIDSEIY